jgi:hypothetical protein
MSVAAQSPGLRAQNSIDDFTSLRLRFAADRNVSPFTLAALVKTVSHSLRILHGEQLVQILLALLWRQLAGDTRMRQSN